MNGILKFIKKNTVIIILVALCIIISVPILVHNLSPKVMSEITADGTISYIIESISILATLFLAIIAVWQTQKANDIAEQSFKTAERANQLNEMIVKIQQEENLPTIIIKEFLGITNYTTTFIENINNKVSLHEARTNDNEVLLGYSVHLFDDDFDSNKKDCYCRSYEICFKYQGKQIIKDIRILNIKFCGYNFEKSFPMSNTFHFSLSNEQNFRLFIFVHSNSDFLNEKSSSYKLIKGNNIDITLEMKTMMNDNYTEVMTIHKHLVKEPEKHFNTKYIELMASSIYDTNKND